MLQILFEIMSQNKSFYLVQMINIWCYNYFEIKNIKQKKLDKTIKPVSDGRLVVHLLKSYSSI